MTTDNRPDPQPATADEVARLRKEVAELQAQLAAYHCLEENTIRVAPREERDELGSDVELIGDFDALQAEGVDISQGGLCLEVGDPLPFDIKLHAEGQEHIYRGNMVWMKSLADGSYRLGFNFVRTDLYGG